MGFFKRDHAAWLLLVTAYMIFFAYCANLFQSDGRSEPERSDLSESGSSYGCAPPIGSVLGWNNRLYKIISEAAANEAGEKLGIASYHGIVSGGFILYRDAYSPRTIVFETRDKRYFKAVGITDASLKHKVRQP